MICTYVVLSIRPVGCTTSKHDVINAMFLRTLYVSANVSLFLLDSLAPELHVGRPIKQLTVHN